MTPQQTELIQQSFAKVVPIADQAAVLFYDRLFEIAPDVKPMFHDADMAEQRRKLMETLGIVVTGLSRLETVLPAASARWPNGTSATAPRTSTIRSSDLPCHGRWRRVSARPGTPNSQTPGRPPTARCRAT